MYLDDLVNKIKLYKNGKLACSRIASHFENKITKLSKQIGEQYYGAIGTNINFKYNNGEMLSGKIVSFQETIWSDIPLCIIDATVAGSKIQLHLSSNERIIKGDFQTDSNLQKDMKKLPSSDSTQKS